MSIFTPEVPPVRVTCGHCHGTGIRERPPRSGECKAPWWDMSSEPFTEWTCGRPLLPGARYCPEHERQMALLAQREGR